MPCRAMHSFTRDSVFYKENVKKQAFISEMASHFHKYIHKSPHTSYTACATNGSRAYPGNIHACREAGSPRYKHTPSSGIATAQLKIPKILSCPIERRKAEMKRSYWPKGAKTARPEWLDSATRKWANRDWSPIPSPPPSPRLGSPIPATARNYRDAVHMGRELTETPDGAEWSLTRQRSPEYRSRFRQSPSPLGVPPGSYWSGIESDLALVSSSDGFRASSPQPMAPGQSPNSWAQDRHQAYEESDAHHPMAIRRYPRKVTNISRSQEHLLFRQMGDHLRQ